MSVAEHLKIDLAEYDERVRTFIPGYEHMLNAAAVACAVALAKVKRPVIVDLGVGTGALSARCLDAMPSASIVGVDADPDILRVATKRLARRSNPVTLIRGDLARVAIPPADGVVSTLALHHIATPAKKRAVYKRCFAALQPGGVVVSGDCHPSSIDALAGRQMQGWLSHLRQSYSAARIRTLLDAWAKEDTYVSLEEELDLMQSVGFAVDVSWRRGAFAVVIGGKE